MKRRTFIHTASSLALGATAANVLWAPPAAGAATSASASAPAGHDAYFAGLNDLLKAQGPGHPLMLLDRERMNHNIDRIRQSVGPDKTYRVVVKSLPSVPLLKHVAERAGTNALMVFHQPFLNVIAQAFPKADVLLGKPMPVRAAERFYAQFTPGAFNPATQIQWLIDSQARLLQYQQLARQLGTQIQCNFEIDVGLHRGGLAAPAALDQALATIAADPQHLSCSGLMGYEPQLTGLKANLDHPAVQGVLDIYNAFKARLTAHGYKADQLTLNGAGSHTLKIYEKDRTMNDLSAGSGVVMPTDFDTFHLLDHQPAAFIATPILKRYPDNKFMPDPPANMQQIYYIYGGYWKAKMVSPADIGPPLYESTNQSPIVTGKQVNLDVDDYMFLRPTQSEFVMLQFGDLQVVADDQLGERWPVFHQTG